MNDRKEIIETLSTKLEERIDFDRETQEQLQPLLEICQGIDPDILEFAHSCIIPDLNVNDFVSEYLLASNSLSEDERKDPLKSILRLEQHFSHRFPTLKIALARTRVIKPHSADVERMISKTKSNLKINCHV